MSSFLVRTPGIGPVSLGFFLLSHIFGCEEAVTSLPPQEATLGESVAGMPAEIAQLTLAQVGNRTIKMSDYALLLSRMDRFERMRYQSEDRRRILLDEMINIELLAMEAKRRGLDRQPATRALVMQSLREEVFAELRRSLPDRADLSDGAISSYFSAHREQFALPESRRLAHIVIEDRALAAVALAEALLSGSEDWTQLVRRYSGVTTPSASEGSNNARPGFVVAGDLGFQTLRENADATDVGKAAVAVAEKIRSAGFQIERDGGVFPQLVKVGERFHIVRRVALQPARQRQLREVEGMVRSRLLEAQFEAARQALLERLEKEIPVQIDEAALARITAPSPTVEP